MAVAESDVRVTVPGPLPPTADEIEALLRGRVSASLGSYYVFWRVLERTVGGRVLSIQQLELASDLARKIEVFSTIVAGLSVGRYSLQLWQWTDRQGRPLQTPTWGVVRTPDDTGLGFAVLPYVVAVVVGAVLSGAFVLADIYLTARKLEAQADLERVRIAQSVSNAIAAASGEERQELVDAFAKANDAVVSIKPQSWLDRLGSKVSGIGASITGASATTGWAVAGIALLALYLFGGRRTR